MRSAFRDLVPQSRNELKTYFWLPGYNFIDCEPNQPMTWTIDEFPKQIYMCYRLQWMDCLLYSFHNGIRELPTIFSLLYCPQAKWVWQSHPLTKKQKEKIINIVICFSRSLNVLTDWCKWERSVVGKIGATFLLILLHVTSTMNIAMLIIIIVPFLIRHKAIFMVFCGLNILIVISDRQNR